MATLLLDVWTSKESTADYASQRYAGSVGQHPSLRDWLRRRLPAQVADVDDPREALLRLRDQRVQDAFALSVENSARLLQVGRRNISRAFQRAKGLIETGAPSPDLLQLMRLE